MSALDRLMRRPGPPARADTGNPPGSDFNMLCAPFITPTTGFYCRPAPSRLVTVRARIAITRLVRRPKGPKGIMADSYAS